MSEESSSPTATATACGSTRTHPTMQQAQVAASHKIIMESFAFFKPTVEKPTLNKLNSIFVQAFEKFNFDPASPVQSFPELQFKMLVQSFPSVEDLIVDAELYSMTTPLLSLFHNIFVLRSIHTFEVPVHLSSMFQPYRKYHSVYEKLWLLSMLGDDPWIAIVVCPHAKEPTG